MTLLSLCLAAFCLLPLGAQTSAPAAEASADSCVMQTKIRLPMRGGPVSITSISGAVIFSAGMAIDADGAPNAYAPHDRGLDRLANARRQNRWVGIATDKRGRPFMQKKGRYRGYYVSTTSLQDSTVRNPADPAKYVDATKIPYLVLPPEVAERFQIGLGDMAVVINRQTGVTAFAIFADVGPRRKIGEGSIALAEALGLPSDPRHDKTEDGLLYVVFPGSGLGQGTLRPLEEIKDSASELYERWGGSGRLRVCLLMPRSSRTTEGDGTITRSTQIQ